VTEVDIPKGKPEFAPVELAIDVDKDKPREHERIEFDVKAPLKQEPGITEVVIPQDKQQFAPVEFALDFDKDEKPKHLVSEAGLPAGIEPFKQVELSLGLAPKDRETSIATVDVKQEPKPTKKEPLVSEVGLPAGKEPSKPVEISVGLGDKEPEIAAVEIVTGNKAFFILLTLQSITGKRTFGFNVKCINNHSLY
jgi:hypothetical protein